MTVVIFPSCWCFHELFLTLKEKPQKQTILLADLKMHSSKNHFCKYN